MESEGRLELALRLIASEAFTQEMAVNYLFQWRSNRPLLAHLLPRIQQLLKAGNYSLLPTAIFIMSIEPNELLEQFCEGLARQSLGCYLLLRWSYSTYLQDSLSARNKLDNCIFARNGSQQLDFEALATQMRQKEMTLNYTIALNDYFDRLFAIPEKLRRHDEAERNYHLWERLAKLHNKFYQQNPSRPAVLLPLQQGSCMAVGVAYHHCLTFSTKDRVPFKIVFETVSERELQHPPAERRKEGSEKEREGLVLPHSYFGTEWREERRKIESTSLYRDYPSYRIQSFMVKSGDDLRQEHMAMQLITMVRDICLKENVKIWLRPYAVLPFDRESGLIEFIEDTRTVSFLKEKSRAGSLREVYQQLFGSNWESSVCNFVESLAGYSLVQYLFQIKDRHNNNILVDSQGHIVHIDFGFIISSSPGNFGFEKAPFKLTRDYIQLMDGVHSDLFRHFKLLFFFALKFVRKYKREIMQRVQIMSHCPGMRCFERYSPQDFQARFLEGTTDEELMERVEEIVSSAVNSYSTGHYDAYQWLTNYIYH